MLFGCGCPRIEALEAGDTQRLLMAPAEQPEAIDA